MLCPRRAEDVHPSIPSEDSWSESTWTPGKRIPAHTVYEKGTQTVLAWQIGWLSSWPEPPRTCSFCGGAYPEDLIRLLEAGWELEATTKAYKKYLNPPGYVEHMHKVLDSLSTGQKVEPFKTPVPPVKLYVQHFTPAQLDKLNSVLRSKNENKDS